MVLEIMSAGVSQLVPTLLDSRMKIFEITGQYTKHL